MSRTTWIGIVAVAAFVIGGFLHLNSSSAPALSEIDQLSTTPQKKNTESDLSTQESSSITDQPAAVNSYTVTGSYYEYSEDWWAQEYKDGADDWEKNLGKAFVCPALEVATGDEALIQKYTNMVKNGNTVNRLSESGRLVINLPWSLYTADMRGKIKESTVSSPIKLDLIELTPKATGVGPCYSFFGIK